VPAYYRRLGTDAHIGKPAATGELDGNVTVRPWSGWRHLQEEQGGRPR
jgi:hypothetical protein